MRTASVAVVAALSVPLVAVAAVRPETDHVTAAAPAQAAPFFTEDFESGNLSQWDDRDGNRPPGVRLTRDPGHVHSGQSAVELMAEPGRGTGADLIEWFPPGRDQVYARWYIQFAADYDQGNLHHTGGVLIGARDRNFIGVSGVKPAGDDWFSSSLEPWRDWGRVPPPGFPYLYTYWMEMQPDPSGPYYGNPFMPDRRVALERDRWYAMELMLKVNTVGRADGEQAFWLDGEQIGHWRDIRWRSVETLKIDCLWLLLYIHDNPQVNRVWFDDVALSDAYIGPSAATPAPGASSTATGAPASTTPPPPSPTLPVAPSQSPPSTGAPTPASTPTAVPAAPVFLPAAVRARH
jgi:hypothetical protein